MKRPYPFCESRSCLLQGMSASPVGMPRFENETIRNWREKQEEMLIEKDASEQETINEMKGKAEKELQDWYKKYDDQLDKTKADNRCVNV